MMPVSSPQTKQQTETDPCQLNWYLNTSTFKMETPETIRISLQKGEWVTSLNFSDAYFHIPIHHRSRKYMRFFLNKQIYPFTAFPFGLATAKMGVYKCGQGSKTHCTDKGYKNPPVSRRQVTQNPFPGNMPTTHPDPLGPLLQTGLGSEHEEIRANPSTGLPFRRLPVRPVDRSGVTNSRKMGKLTSVAPLSQDSEYLHSQAIHVLDRTIHSHREASLVRSSPLESHT